MRYYKPISFALMFLILAVLAVCMAPGCAMLDSILQTHFKTFELTLGGEKVVVNLPNALPSMDKAVKSGETCFNAKVCRQEFCVTIDPGHDHVDFVYMGTDVIALIWIREKETESDKRYAAWAYIEKKPISVPIDKIKDLINKDRNPNQTSPSLYRMG